MPSMKHVHKYERLVNSRDGKNIVYACRLPDCSHFLSRNLTVGKKSICWKCEDTFVMTVQSINMRRPTCGCKTKVREIKESQALDDFLSKIVGGID